MIFVFLFLHYTSFSRYLWSLDEYYHSNHKISDRLTNFTLVLAWQPAIIHKKANKQNTEMMMSMTLLKYLAESSLRLKG